MNTHDDDLRGGLGRIRNRGSRYKSFFAVVYGGVPDIDPGKHRLLIHGLDQIRGRRGYCWQRGCRALLGRGVIFAGAMKHRPSGRAIIEPYRRPLQFEKDVVRTVGNSSGQPRASGARTPHHLVNGTMTPNGLT